MKNKSFQPLTFHLCIIKPNRKRPCLYVTLPRKSPSTKPSFQGCILRRKLLDPTNNQKLIVNFQRKKQEGEIEKVNGQFRAWTWRIVVIIVLLCRWKLWHERDDEECYVRPGRHLQCNVMEYNTIRFGHYLQLKEIETSAISLNWWKNACYVMSSGGRVININYTRFMWNLTKWTHYKPILTMWSQKKKCWYKYT